MRSWRHSKRGECATIEVRSNCSDLTCTLSLDPLRIMLIGKNEISILVSNHDIVLNKRGNLKDGVPATKVKSWCESNDPEFVAKAADVVGLYMAPPENAIIICVDEILHRDGLWQKDGTSGSNLTLGALVCPRR
jgi:hypothetical protein